MRLIIANRERVYVTSVTWPKEETRSTTQTTTMTIMGACDDGDSAWQHASSRAAERQYHLCQATEA